MPGGRASRKFSSSVYDKLKAYLCEVVDIFHWCVVAKRLFSSLNLFNSMCAAYVGVMESEVEGCTVGLGGEERPGSKSEKTGKIHQEVDDLRVEEGSSSASVHDDQLCEEQDEFSSGEDYSDWSKSDEEEQEIDADANCDWFEWDIEEEQVDCIRSSFTSKCKSLQQQEGDSDSSEDEDDYSDWSDDDEDDFTESSGKSAELWESFNNSDPYNPLNFSSSTGSKTKSSENGQTCTSKTLSSFGQEKALGLGKGEEMCPGHSQIKELGKKVNFSDDVTVVWTFASRTSRDGSCWLQMARDRDRFMRRVEDVGRIISPCLTQQHRTAVWERIHKQSEM
ncbi:protein phosphatase 1 regulatory subunit 15A [Denticeps clupeoides]|uniref:protein phosphatase 1 regulatory subunit 15A n=1 Tax=Denticeps clupeoides TaxID=299321 RepID=UPI0010A2CA9F|nr:protein phosphatase 1 regulatory subunit 15B-like [Denticeps clupeoides]